MQKRNNSYPEKAEGTGPMKLGQPSQAVTGANLMQGVPWTIRAEGG